MKNKACYSTEKGGHPETEFDIPYLALNYKDGKFALASGTPIAMSPLGSAQANVEVIIEALITLRENFAAGYTPEILNKEVRFLDMAPADELGNSRSIWVGPRQGRLINEDIWVNFVEDILGIFLNLQVNIVQGRLPDNPPNIYKEDAEQAIKAVLSEIEETRILWLEDLEKNSNSQCKDCPDFKFYQDTLHLYRRDIHLMQTKCKNLKQEVKNLRTARSKNSERSKQKGADCNYQVKMRHNDHHENDSLSATLIKAILDSDLLFSKRGRPNRRNSK